MSKQPLIPPFDEKFRLKDYDPDYTGGYKSEEELQSELEKDIERLAELQNRLYAEAKHALLIVIQAMDTGGKDGLIKHVFRGLNPTGVQITSFKAPSAEELSHDYLWRIHQHTPPLGTIGVFNRSHYEDVLIVRVHNLVPEKVWKKRYEDINAFENLLADNGITVLKFYLHISKAEQKQRLEDRLKDPTKHWKFNPDDLKERALWDTYMDAYEDAIGKCNTKKAPWHVVPANEKWYRNYVVTKALIDALEALDPQYPPPPPNMDQIVVPD